MRKIPGLWRKGCRLVSALLVAVLLMTSIDIEAVAATNTLTLPSALQIIDEEAFYGDTSLSKVTLSSKTKEIRARAFANSTLREINLPSSITYIAEDAFSGSRLSKVTATSKTYAYNWAVKHGYISSVSTPSGVQAIYNENSRNLYVKWNKISAATGFKVYVQDNAGTELLYETKDSDIYIPADSFRKEAEYTVYVQAQKDNVVSEKSKAVKVYISESEKGTGYIRTPSVIMTTGSSATIEYYVNVEYGLIDTVSLYGDTGTVAKYEAGNNVVSTIDSSLVIDGTKAPFNTKGTYQLNLEFTTLNGNTYSAGDCVVTVTEPVPDAPTLSSTTLNSTNTSVTVKWSTVKNATGYKVLYGNTSDMSKATSKTVSGQNSSSASVSVTAGKTYYFWVTAYNSTGDSGASNRSMVVVPEPEPSCTIDLDRYTWKPDYKAAVTDVCVTCDDTYTVTVSRSARSWLSYEQVGNTLYVSVTKNTTGSKRTGYIYVECDGHEEEEELKVVQDYGEDIDAPTISAGIQSIYVVVKWSAVSGAEGYWLQCALNNTSNVTYNNKKYSTSFRDYEYVYDT